MNQGPGDYSALFQHINAVLDDQPIPTLHFVKQMAGDRFTTSFSATPQQVSVSAEMRPAHFLSGGFSASTDLASQVFVKCSGAASTLNLTAEFSPEYERSVEDAYYGRKGELQGIQRNVRAQLQQSTSAVTSNVLFNQRGRIAAVSGLTRVSGPAGSVLDMGYEHVNVGTRGITLSAAGARATWRNCVAVVQANSTHTAAFGAVAQFTRLAVAAKVQLSPHEAQVQLGMLQGVGNGQFGVVVDSQRNFNLAYRCIFGAGQLEVKSNFKIGGDSTCAVQWVM